jgi:hypothetical protein
MVVLPCVRSPRRPLPHVTSKATPSRARPQRRIEHGHNGGGSTFSTASHRCLARPRVLSQVERRAPRRHRLKVFAPSAAAAVPSLPPLIPSAKHDSMAWPPRAEEPPTTGPIGEYCVRGVHGMATEAAALVSTSAGVCFGPYIGRQRTRPRCHAVTMHPNRSCGDGTRPTICSLQRTSFLLRFCSKVVEIFPERCRYLTQTCCKKCLKRLTFRARAARCARR